MKKFKINAVRLYSKNEKMQIKSKISGGKIIKEKEKLTNNMKPY